MALGFDAEKIDASQYSIENQVDNQWPMQGYDRRHTGRSPYSTENNIGIEIWRFGMGNLGWISSGIVVCESGIYFGTQDNYIYSLNADGVLNWRYETSYDIWATPIIDDEGTIYFAGSRLYAMYPNGNLKWELGINGEVMYAPSMSNDGTLFLGTTSGKLYSINTNGTINWFYNTSNGIYSSPAIFNDGIVFIGSYDGHFYAIYPNGTIYWEINKNGILRGSPSIADDGTIYVEIGGNLYALNPDNGSVIWELENIGMTHLHPSLGLDGTIYIGTSNYKFYAINPDGTIKWEYELSDSSALWRSAAAIGSDGTLYFGTHVNYPYDGGGDIIALNPDGSLKWSKRIAIEWIDSSPAIGTDGTIVIGSINRDQGGGDAYGCIHAFNNGIENNKPTPPIITGVTNGKAGEIYEYTFSSTDLDGDDVEYYINWEGAGNTADWYGPFESGYILSLNYSWPSGEKTIIAKARDTFGEDSELSTLEVTMPRNKPYINLYHWFLDMLDRWEVLFET